MDEARMEKVIMEVNELKQDKIKLESKIDKIAYILEEVMIPKQDKIHEETKKTNGRVTKLENKMSIVENFHETCPGLTLTDKVNKLEQETVTARYNETHPENRMAILAWDVGKIVLTVAAVIAALKIFI